MLERLLAFLGIHRYRTRLQFVSGPTRVRLRGHVASANSIESPSSGTRAAWLRYVLGTVESYYDPEQGRTIEQVQEIARHDVSSELLLSTEDGLVRLPAGSFRVKAAGEALSALTPLSGHPPPELHAAISASSSGSLIYGEQYLRQDDAVELRATVASARDSEAPWTVLTEEDAVVIDRSLEELGIS